LLALSKVERSENFDNAFYVFYVFFDMTLQKNLETSNYDAHQFGFTSSWSASLSTGTTRRVVIM